MLFLDTIPLVWGQTDVHCENTNIFDYLTTATMTIQLPTKPTIAVTKYMRTRKRASPLGRANERLDDNS